MRVKCISLVSRYCTKVLLIKCPCGMVMWDEYCSCRQRFVACFADESSFRLGGVCSSSSPSAEEGGESTRGTLVVRVRVRLVGA